MASITRSIQATEFGVCEKLCCGGFRSITVAVCQLTATDAELAFCAMRQQFQCGGIQNEVAYPCKRAANRDRFVGPQQLPTGVRADLGGTIRIDDLSARP